MMTLSLKDTLMASFSGEWGDESKDSSGVFVLRTTNFTNTGDVSFENVITRKVSIDKINQKRLNPGDIILEKSGGTKTTPVGRVVYFDKPEDIYLCNNFTQVLRPNTEIVDSKYLFYALYAKYQFHEADRLYNKTTGIQNLQLGRYLNLLIPVPALTEQRDIRYQLDILHDAIAKKKKILEKIDDLVKSQFIEMFGGYSLRNKQPGWVKVGAVAEVVGGSTPKTDKPEYWDGDFYWVTPAELQEDDFIVTHTQRSLTEKGVSSCSLRRLPVGTVLLSSRAPIGKVAIAGVEMYCNQGFKNLICGEELNSVYVYALLKYNSDYLNSLGRGATFKEISKSIVENIYIPVPAIARQNEFARFVEQTDKSKFRIKQSLEKLEILYKALLQKYFG